MAAIFADAPFPVEEQTTWPTVSVVVCAYNAADTLDDCLSSLERLRYPSYEVILVNDGSKDDTEAIARRYPSVRLITTANNGLSAARNIGLAAATGTIVAYTDADVRVDPDWLAYLVQPFLHSDVVAVGGPNVVPEDDPWVAQCVARAPGGPTHVLFDDRIAEHVPGCNMAMRRDALLAIGGFNPIYLRAGDDVDVCWRLQAAGGTIGFAPSALVWHHHRPSVRAFWRQQVGYGEGEVWLKPHHPDKFVGSRIQWRGHVYSPLPFVRSLFGTRVNAGPWGTAPFPSVYRTNASPIGVAPHTAWWQVAAVLLLVTGTLLVTTRAAGFGAALALAGLVGLTATVIRSLRLAWQTDIRTLPAAARTIAQDVAMLARLLIAWLHILQPLARARGRLRGALTSPEFELSHDRSIPTPTLPLGGRRAVVPGRARPGAQLLVRDLAVARSAADAGGRAAAQHARRHGARDRRRLAPGPRRQPAAGPLGPARRADAGRGTCPRQSAGADRPPPARDAVLRHHRWRASPRLLATLAMTGAGGWLAGAVAVVVGLTVRASWHAAATMALADTVMTRVLVDAGAMPLWTPATTGAAHANAAVAATPPVAVASTRHAH